jgi:hypothetical protein
MQRTWKGDGQYEMQSVRYVKDRLESVGPALECSYGEVWKLNLRLVVSWREFDDGRRPRCAVVVIG